MLQRRFLHTESSTLGKFNLKSNRNKWSIKQVTKSNFKDVLEEVKLRILGADYVAVGMQRTGAYTAAWQKAQPFDTAEIAYLKAKRAAERFQVVQFGLCAFSVRASAVTAFPYNFHLFPRDELKNGMPSYSFACQTSYLTTMARIGFNFNTCIYDGISYLSRTQELAAKHQMGNPMLGHTIRPSPASSVADAVFIERIKSRVRTWRNACVNSKAQTQEPLVRSLRKIVFGEEFGSRPCMDIDVCSERQVQLVLEVLKEFSDDVVSLLIPANRGAIQGVRVVLTSSKEDKSLFEGELKNAEEEQSRHARGFREVIDMISASQKPVVALNALDGVSLCGLFF